MNIEGRKMPWITDKAKQCFRKYFTEAEEKITDFVGRYDEEGLTAKLIDNYFNDVVNSDVYVRLRDCVKRLMNLNLRMWANPQSRRTEGITGADFGIILEIEYSEFRDKKAVLMQAKKWRSPSQAEYERMQKQAKLLKKTTSSGYFIFYQPKGVMVVDIGQILGRDRITEDVIYETGRKFSQFMTDYFLETFVGDRSESTIEIALGKNPEIPVKYSINISLRGWQG